MRALPIGVLLGAMAAGSCAAGEDLITSGATPARAKAARGAHREAVAATAREDRSMTRAPAEIPAAAGATVRAEVVATRGVVATREWWRPGEWWQYGHRRSARYRRSAGHGRQQWWRYRRRSGNGRVRRQPRLGR